MGTGNCKQSRDMKGQGLPEEQQAGWCGQNGEVGRHELGLLLEG